MSTNVSLMQLPTRASPTITAPVIDSPSPEDNVLIHAKEAFLSESSDYTVPCERVLGKQEWKKMSCCRKFWSYLICESYQDIGRNFMKKHPKTYLAFQKKVKLIKKQEEQTVEKNQADEAHQINVKIAQPVAITVHVEQVQPVDSPEPKMSAEQRVEIIQIKQNDQHIHLAVSSEDGTIDFASQILPSIILPENPQNSRNNPSGVISDENIPKCNSNECVQ